ncbi:MAG TPA: hypothetical protein VGY32_11530 [Solirubrobacteraceae bacterium]|jgi:hypothetical protein|nr:hypothetical protein [Solirubrobacteraceae bacterium]
MTARLSRLRSPATSGLHYLDQLWEERHERPPVLDDDTREFLLAELTHGQHRRELLTDGKVKTLPALHYMDGRLFYGALMGELGQGPITRDRGTNFLEHQRAVYRVTVRVPRDWAHVGLIPCRDEAGSTQYPHRPKTVISDTWVDGAELMNAYRAGWQVWICERIIFTSGKPLDVWCDRLVRQWSKARGNDEQRGWLRDVLLQSVGALASRGRLREVRLPRGAPLPPLVVRRWIDPDTAEVVCEVRDDLSPLRARMRHPELAVGIWARARARMTRHMLSLPRDQIIAVDGDAIYLTGMPNWVDKGRTGELRLKERREGPLSIPRSIEEVREVFASAEVVA